MLSWLSCEGGGMSLRILPTALISPAILPFILRFPGTFFKIPGLYRQANTRPASRPPSDWPDSPRGEKKEAGRPGPPPFSLCAEHVQQPGGASPLHNVMDVK